jgi:hypothetical protein
MTLGVQTTKTETKERHVSWQQVYKIRRQEFVLFRFIALGPINMKLTTSRYCVMLIVQFGLLLVDISVNCFSDFARKSSVVLLLLFM